MKILMVNKFLFPNGGSETYLFQLGKALQRHGHEVQYFGMEHEGRLVGNAAGAYTSDMEFNGGGVLGKLAYPVKTIYSREARRKIRLVLDDFQPDAVHLNNFNYQLTPSVILEIRRWEKRTGNRVRVVFTAHDYQLICPNHMLRNPRTNRNCEACAHGRYLNCAKGRCIHGSVAKSLIGSAEGAFWRANGAYGQIDAVVCPTRFMKTKMDLNPAFAGKTVVMRNFIEPAEKKIVEKKDYVLYFGRFSQEKGIRTLLAACGRLPRIPFVFAGGGPLEGEIARTPNVRNAGFLKGDALEMLIREARFSVYPSEWYENCPYSVMESQRYGTPVLGADIGGIPELIADGKTGELFESGNVDDLTRKIDGLYRNRTLSDRYGRDAADAGFSSSDDYCRELARVYAAPEKREGGKG